MNHFALLDLPEQFPLELKELERRYVSAQRLTHPDRLLRASAEEKLAATRRSMQINDAYQTLKLPLSRLEHLLALQGVEVNTERATVKPSPAILMEALERREMLEEADTPQAIASLVETAETERNALLTHIAMQCSAAQWNEVAQSAIRLRYLEKFLEEAALKNGDAAAL
jgi:molecular chaperone HscB